MKIPRTINSVCSLTLLLNFKDFFFVNRVKSVICKSGKDSSRKETRVEVEACCVPVRVHFCCRCALLGWLYCGGCISTSGKPVVLTPGGTKACQPEGIGVHCSNGAATAKGDGR